MGGHRHTKQPSATHKQFSEEAARAFMALEDAGVKYLMGILTKIPRASDSDEVLRFNAGKQSLAKEILIMGNHIKEQPKPQPEE